MNVALGPVLAAGLSLLAAAWMMTWLAASLMRRQGAVDQPGERRSHQIPTPRGGGLGFVLPWLVFLALTATSPELWILLLATSAMAALGLAEDLRDWPALRRFLLQIVVVTGALAALVWIQAPALTPASLLVAVLLALVGTLWLVNLYNFMDGIDGLAAWQGLFVSAGLGLLAFSAGDRELGWLCLALAAALLGYLPHNFPRARVFMGDVGSTALGLAFALLTLLGVLRGAWSLWLPLMLLALFVVDATATLGLRLISGERWYTAHRRHSYQRLVAQGFSHAKVVAIYMGINLLLIAPLTWLSRDSAPVQAAACIGLYGVLFSAWWLARKT